ncbi:MAG: hypothetical protein ACM3TN_15215 [Alphaproteobacteria bacterium]
MSEVEFFYKYCGLKDGENIRVDFLSDCLFRFTQPDQLNDPFEVRPVVLTERYSEEDKERARKEALKIGLPKDDLDRFLPLFLETSPRRMTPEEFPGFGLSKTARERRSISINDRDGRIKCKPTLAGGMGPYQQNVRYILLDDRTEQSGDVVTLCG